MKLSVLTFEDRVTPATISFGSATLSAGEADGSAAIVINRAGASLPAATVTLSATGGTATSGSDYTGLPFNVNFAAGQTTTTINLSIVNDTAVEGNETVNLALTNPTNGDTLGSPSTATLTIIDNDNSIQFSSATYSVGETAGTLNVLLTRSGNTSAAASVLVSATGGTATSDVDFTGLPQTVNFASGQTTANAVITIVDDAFVEGSENIFMALSGASGASVGAQSTATTTITDNDTGASVSFGQATYVTQEGLGTLTVNVVRVGDTSVSVTAPITVTGGTATSGSDYTGVPIVANFAVGQTLATVTVTIVDDAFVESTETITLGFGTLSASSGNISVGSIGSTTISINDNDVPNLPGVVQFNQLESNTIENSGTAIVSISRVNGSTGTIQIPLTITGTAISNSDYQSLPTTITFEGGQTSFLLQIPLIDDAVIEGFETIIITLGQPTGGASIGSPNVHTIRIKDAEALTAAGAGSGTPSVVQYSATGNVLATFNAFDASITGGVRVATGDVSGDGVDDIIVGTGPGGGSLVRIFDGVTRSLIVEFSAFELSFTAGVFVAQGDLDNDGIADVIVTPDQGGGPIVAAYNGSILNTGVGGDAAQFKRFFGIEDAAFRGGARPTVGDFNGDTFADVIVSAGFLGGPRIAIFDGTSLTDPTATPNRLVGDFFAFEDSLRNGAFVSAGDFNSDGKADLAFGGGPSGGPRVRVFDAAAIIAAGSFETLDQLPPSAQICNFFAGDDSLRGGVRLSFADVNRDAVVDLQTGSGEGEATRIRNYLAATLLSSSTPTPDAILDPFGTVLAGGVFVG